MDRYDVIIIGKGPAGLSASLYTSRAGLQTLIIGRESLLWKAAEIENYFGFEKPVSGGELLKTGEEQAKRLGVKIREGEVTALSQNGDEIEVKLSDGTDYTGDALLIATGMPRNRPNIPGLSEYEGKGISYCTTCDGFLYRGKKVGILGGGLFALEEANELVHFTKDITLFTNGKQPEQAVLDAAQQSGFKVVQDAVTGIFGGEKLGGLQLGETKFALDGLFIASGTASAVDFAAKMGIFTENSAVMVDEKQQTNLPGVYAAGDCCAKLKQVSVAVGQGAVAGKAMAEYVREKKKQLKKVEAAPAAVAK